MSPKPRIFVSYARSDGKEIAREICERLRSQHGLTLWHDLADMEGGNDWWRQITEAIDQVEHLVLIMTPNALKSPIVRREWRYARQKGRCVTPIMASPDLSFDDLPGWMGRHSFVEWWEPESWTRLVRRLEAEGDTPRVPFMVGDLPENFVPRPAELQQLIGALVDENQVEPAAVTTAIRSAGGYGKTTLARAICHDEAIQDVFVDGILWVTLGENPGELTGRVIDLIQTLSGKHEAFGTTEAAINRLKELLADRRLLFVIDDVWNHAHLRPFLEGGQNCVRLITTRFVTAIPEKARRTQVDAMEINEAIDLLCPTAPPEAIGALTDLVQRLGKWPLLLKLTGAMLRRRERLGEELADALDWVNTALNQRGVTAFDERNAEERDQAVSKTLDVSLDQLKDDERQLFAELAVFPEDVEVPLATLEVLWRKGRFDTEEYCQQLFESGLLWSLDLISRRLRLHDVVRAYLRPPNSQSLAAKLIAGYQEQCRSEWHDLSDDGYILKWLPYHLIEAGQEQAYLDLCFDFKWLQLKLSSCGINAIVTDTELAPLSHELEQLGGALRMSAHVLVDEEQQLAAQLLGRLHDNQSERTAGLVNEARSRLPQSHLIPLGGRHLLPPGPLIQTLKGHTGSVKGALLMPDDQHALSWSYDDTLRIWNLSSGSNHVIGKLQGPIDGATLLNGGTKVLSWSNEDTEKQGLIWSDKNTLRLWSLDEGESRVLGKIAGVIECVLPNTDSSCVVICSSKSGGICDVRTVQVCFIESGSTRVLERHDATEIGALLLDDANVLTWSNESTLRLWNFKTGKCLTLKGHSGSVHGALLLEGSSRALSWSEDGNLRIWTLETGSSCILEGHSAPVNGATLFDHGVSTLTWSDDHTLRVWNLETGKSRVLEGHTEPVVGALILDGGNRAVSWANTSSSYVREDRELRLWDLNTGACHIIEANGMSYSSDYCGEGRHIISYHPEDSLLWHFDLKADSVRPLEGHTAEVWGTALMEGGNRTLSWSGDGTLRLWNLESKDRENNGRHRRPVSAIAQLNDDQSAVSWSWDGTLLHWKLETGCVQVLERGINASLRDGYRYAITWAENKHPKIWDLETLENRTVMGDPDGICGAELLQDNRHALTWLYYDTPSDGQTLWLWDLEAGSGKMLGQSCGDCVDNALMLGKGNRVLVWSDEVGGFGILDFDAERTHILEECTGTIGGAILLNEGEHTLSWSYDAKPCIWDLKTGRSRTLKGHGHDDTVNGLVLLRNGREALSWSDDATLRIWDLDTGENQVLVGHTAPVAGALLLNDGMHALSWCREEYSENDESLRLWNLKTGCSKILQGHEGPVLGAVSFGDGKHIFSWSENNTANIWDLEQATLASKFIGDDVICCCIGSRDKRRVIAGDERGRVMLFGTPGQEASMV